ncbi:SAM-dependent methyltransferase, partial [Enterococcus hirae]
MSFYEDRILPHIIDRACSMGQVMKLRSQVEPHAKGVVLEVGMGSAINMEFYNAENVDMVYGLEPSEGMRRKA